MRLSWNHSLLSVFLVLFLITGCDRSGHIQGTQPTNDTPDAMSGVDAALSDGGMDAEFDGDIPDSEVPDTAVPLDIKERLEALPGVISVNESRNRRERFFKIVFRMKLDHFDVEDERTFDYEVGLRHVGEDMPVVALASGYSLDILNSDSLGFLELEEMLSANRLSFGHRFFQGAVPSDENLDFTKVTIRQAAEDLHVIISALKTIYSQDWVGTGWSKGGMTIILQEYFHDDDLDLAVPMVAPISLGNPDPSYQEYWKKIGSPACRARIDTSIRKMLRDPAATNAILRDAGYDLPDWYIPAALAKWDWAFWQYGGESYCFMVPDGDASLQEHLSAMLRWFNIEIPEPRIRPAVFTDEELFSLVYPLQAETELGQPRQFIEETIQSYLDEGLISQSIYDEIYDERSYRELLMDYGYAVNDFDEEAMKNVHAWLKSSARDMLAIYGEFDPWSGGMIELSADNGSKVYVAPGANHATMISDLSVEEQREIVARVHGFLPNAAIQYDLPVPTKAQRAMVMRLASGGKFSGLNLVR